MKTWQDINDYYILLRDDDVWTETGRLMLQAVALLSAEPNMQMVYRGVAQDTQALLLWLPQSATGQVVHVLPYEGNLWVFRDNVSPESYYGTARQVTFENLLRAVTEQLRATLLKP